MYAGKGGRRSRHTTILTTIDTSSDQPTQKASTHLLNDTRCRSRINCDATSDYLLFLLTLVSLIEKEMRASIPPQGARNNPNDEATDHKPNRRARKKTRTPHAIRNMHIPIEDAVRKTPMRSFYYEMNSYEVNTEC